MLGQPDGHGRIARLPHAPERIAGLIAGIDRVPASWVLLLGLLVMPVVAVADHTAGSAYSFSVFYLLVVVAVSATGRMAYALVVALVAAVLWAVVDGVARPENALLSATWNALARFTVLYICAMLVTAVVAMARDERATSRTDPLTGLLNRRGFADLAERDIARAARSSAPTTLVYVDIDGFKAVNDLHGHASGDRLLVDVARTLSAQARRTDVVARLGGDEFACLLPGTGDDAARHTVLRAKQALDELCRQAGWPVHFSIGVVTFVEAPRSVDDVLSAADRLMYAAKRDGKRSNASTVAAEVVRRTDADDPGLTAAP